MKIVIALGLVLLASVAIASAPVPGTYKSESLTGGTFLDGRFSESYAGGAQGAEGNVMHVMSWDGASGALGTEWIIACPALDGTPVLISDTRDEYGTGMVVYQTFYTGGSLFLAASGPWGDEDYYGVFDYYSHETTFIFVMGTPYGYDTNATMSGSFDDYCLCFNIIANGSSVGAGTLAPGYPPYLDGDCMEGVVSAGEYGDAYDVTITIYECASGTEPTNWGSIKALYR
ncbi:hypothetical protein ACFL2Z_03870 [Candidatus Eisenbacteria bacterium]|uniref:Uncharacterized protein n=1 Tax=Eiseniibacteriota bacterium TaxID=2212470 RepID=A0ABV6YQ46_UNCEI